MKKSINLVVVAVAIALVMINALLFYTAVCSGNYISYENIFSQSDAVSKDEIRAVMNILSLADNDKKTAYEVINEQYLYYDSEYYSMITSYKSYDAQELEEAKRQRDIYSKASEMAYDAMSYPDYVLSVINNTADMMDISIFNSHTNSKSFATALAEYKELLSVKPEYFEDSGLMAMLSFRASDIIAVISVFSIGGLSYALYRKRMSQMKNCKGQILVFSLLVAVTVLAIYIFNIALSSRYLFVNKLSIPIQSASMFYTSVFEISIGQFLVMWVLSKLAILFIIYFAFMAILILPKKPASIITAVFIAAELLVYIKSDVNIFSAFCIEKLVAGFNNITLFSNVVLSIYPFFVLLFTALVITAVIFSVRVNQMYNRYVSIATKAYYDDINEKYRQTRAMRHDMNNHLLAISALLDIGDIASAKQYLGEVFTNLQSVKMNVKTGCEVLDALIFKKLEQAHSLGITLDIEFSASLESKSISDYDLCTIFGNILDNAIEAVSKLEADKNITLEVKSREDMLIIICKNPYSDIKPQFKTTKPDAKNHGQGIERINAVSEKYGGICEISVKDQIFTVSVILNS